MTSPHETTERKPTPQMSNWKKWTIVAVVAALIALAVALTINPTLLGTLQNEFVTWIRAAGKWGWIIIIALLILHAFVPFPLEFAAVAAGATYGFWLGTILSWIGIILGGALSFWLARKYGRPYLDRKLGENQRNWLQIHSRDQGAIALLISRMLPFVSFTLISYAAGLTRISWWTFLWTTAVGILPITLMSVLYGANMAEMPKALAIAIPLIAIAIVIFLHFYARHKGWHGKHWKHEH